MMASIAERVRNFSPVVWVVLLLAIGGGLRLINLAEEPLWGDEALSLGIVRHFENLEGLIRYLQLVEIHPPLYYILLHYWVSWFGTSEFAVRFPSFVAGLAVIPLTYYVASLLFRNRAAAFTAVVFAALLPMQIEYSQEARPYIFLVVAGLTSLIALWQYHQTERVRYCVLYAAAGSIGLYLHYGFVLTLLGLASLWLLFVLRQPTDQRSRAFVVWLGVHAVIALGFFPWVSTLLAKVLLGEYVLFGVPRTISFTAERAPTIIEFTLQQLIWTNKGVGVAAIEAIAPFLAKFSILAALLLVVWRLSKQGIAVTQRTAIGSLLWLLVIPLILFVFSPLSLPYSPKVSQHMIFGSVLLALLVGYLAAQLQTRERLAFIALLLVSTLTYTASVVGNDANWDTQHRLKAVAEVINEDYRPGDIVVIAFAFARTDLNHYLRPDISATSLVPANYYGIDVEASRETLGLIENEAQFRLFAPSYADAAQKLQRLTRDPAVKRVWLAYVDNGSVAHQWFRAAGWRHGFQSPHRRLLPLDMFARPLQR